MIYICHTCFQQLDTSGCAAAYTSRAFKLF